MNADPEADGAEPTMTDHDTNRIEAVLAFWFKEKELSAPQIDGRILLDQLLLLS